MKILNEKSISLTLIGLGLVISGYLLSRHLILAGAGVGGEMDVCSAIFGRGCDAALSSPVSFQFGLPLAGWGVVFYTTLAALLLLAWLLGKPFQVEAMFAAFGLSLVALFGSLVLVMMMFANQALFCPFCAVVHAINLFLPFPLRRMTGRPIRQFFQASKAGVKSLLTRKPFDYVQTRWKLVLGFITVTLVAMVMYQWVRIEVISKTVSTNLALDPQRFLAVFESGVKHDIPIEPDDPMTGPSNALVRLVVFSDFQCPACRYFSHVTAELVERLEVRPQIIFKHFPLGMACNSFMNTDLHPRACEAAWAAEAARQQGKFWAYHNALFTSDLNSGRTTVGSIAMELGLDLRQFESDRIGEATRMKVQSDVDLAFRLGVDATPAIFLNGRRVYDIRPESLQFLIAQAHQQMADRQTIGVQPIKR